MPDERLSAQDVERYEAHVSLPGIGEIGQRRLRSSRVLVVGVGGLGCPVARYLAAGGVGALTLIDDDVVTRGNLQRQILFGEKDIDAPKVEAAATGLRALHPEVRIDTRALRLTASNARELAADHDLVVDGSDNFATRYVINDACVLEGVPLVSGGLYRFEGQVATFRSPDTACYRCLFRSPPPQEAPCAEAGVLASLAGVIGTLQAGEALQLLAGGDSPLLGRLLTVNVREAVFRRIDVPRDPGCPLCGDSPSIREPTALAVLEADGG